MSDRGLLERAAKAAGIENLAPQGNVIICNDEDGYSAVWNPLTDDGDAFRLAVDLDIPLRIDAETEILRNHQTFSLKSDIRRALIRRAIVGAAAAMAGDAPSPAPIHPSGPSLKFVLPSP